MTPFGTNTEASCEHFIGIDESKVSPRTPECEECEKERTDWVALRMCLVCGHVGCCNSSEVWLRSLWLHYRINNGNGAMFISNILDNY